MLPRFAAVVFLLLLSAQPKAALVQLLCFCSLDPKAVNTTVVYDWDHKAFYKRDTLRVPLPQCSEIHPPQNYSCSVCLGPEKVFTVCLLENSKAELTQEAPGTKLNISVHDCPEFAGDPAPSAAPATSPAQSPAPDSRRRAAVSISVALAVLFSAVIAVFILKEKIKAWMGRRRHQQVPEDDRENGEKNIQMSEPAPAANGHTGAANLRREKLPVTCSPLEANGLQT